MIVSTKLTSFLCRLSLLLVCGFSAAVVASGSVYHKVDRQYPPMQAAPKAQSQADADVKSAGCITCHSDSDAKNMHVSDAVKLGCSDCHGGDATVLRDKDVSVDDRGNSAFQDLMQRAHVLPLYPDAWPSSANPQRTYTLLNKESREFVRFINPSDFRVARGSCGACHQDVIEASTRSLHSSSAMFLGGAAYNNGILPFKNYMLGEAYSEDSKPIILKGPVIADEFKDEARARGVIDALYPLPNWETMKPGDVFRVFERGGRNISNLFPETGIPNSTGLIQRLEEPGRPDIRQSNRGPGTGQRISVPLINITKTRLNDPVTWFMGTNDQPGDYRHSGCASCHVIYSNDRDERHSGPYASMSRDGKSATLDPMIDKTESGHPIKHSFTRAVPTSQCMVCHMHQPNMFMNTFLGYTMWDYESDAAFMWPEKQLYPSAEEERKVLDRNPEGAAPRGNWRDVEFLKKVWDNNDKLTDTQFADYHGHGWNFRAVFKRDKKGHLLDEKGKIVSNDDPEKFQKAVHMASIHLDKGMHCVDCHFANDNHGNGYIYGEVAQAVEISCVDCHGSAKKYPSLFTSGPAAIAGGTNMSLLRTPDGRKRFEWKGNDLYQRSMLYPDKEWQMSLVKDSVTKSSSHYNEKSARAKLMSRDTKDFHFGEDVSEEQLAHSFEEMECYACHSAWTNTCGGCHLPIEANRKTERHHYEGGETRNYATYNPQVLGDQMYMLGKRALSKGGKYAPVRSSSALVLSSTNANREKIYIQQPPVASSGHSSQAFNAHYPHTARKTETKQCSDCHLSKQQDNNAIMSQLLLLGTNAVNFLGYNAWLGDAEEITAVQVTEWAEPQAVIGSYLHRYAYPDWFKEHQDNQQRLKNSFSHKSGRANCLQMRGEYLYVAEGSKGMRVYDIASISNKGVSQKIISAPVSPLGQDTHVASSNATCIALPSIQPIRPESNQGYLMRVENQEQPFLAIYHYAVVTDSEEGLILVNVDTLADGEPRNNFLERALTWNENGVLDGAKHVTIAGLHLYVLTDKALVVVDVEDPLKPRLVAQLPMDEPVASALQFRYLFVTDKQGVKVIDVTQPENPQLVSGSQVLIEGAQKLYLSRSYAYVAAGDKGLLIVDIEKPTAIKQYQLFNPDNKISDARDVVVAATNASLFAYIADGEAGLKVVQLFSPKTQPNFYGYSPEPKPQLIAQYKTKSAALSLSRPIERDRAVDESGGQIAVFGRKGARPLNAIEMKKLYLDKQGKPWFVEDTK